LEAWFEQTSANLISNQRGEIGDAVPRREVVIVPGPVRHWFGGLGKFQIISDVKGSRPVIRDGHEPRKIDRACHTNEPNVRGATVSVITVLDRLQDGRAARNRAVLDLLPVGAMIAGDRQVVEIVLGRVKEAPPIEHEPIDDGAAIQLSAERVQNQAGIDGEGLKGTLVDLECVAALENRHSCLDLRVQGHRQAPDLNCDKVAGNE